VVIMLAFVVAGVVLTAQGRIPPQPPYPPPVGQVVTLDPALDRVVSSTAVVEKVAGGLGFAEGPLWTRDNALLVSDLPANAIMRVAAGRQPVVFRKPSGYTGSEQRAAASHIGSNGLTYDQEGRLIVAEHGDRRVTRIEAIGQVTVLADRYEGKRLNSPNDVVVKSDGSIYFTDPPYGLQAQLKDPAKELPFSGIYRIANGKLLLLAQDLAFPNGLGFSPDERFLYVASSESAKRLWMRYEVRADGSLGPGSVFYDASGEAGQGVPDGLKVDESGNLFATGPGGVVIISPAGRMLGRIELPEVPANVAWGDAGKTLYITARTSVYRVRVITGGKRPCC
jgi:gluconolactonase